MLTFGELNDRHAAILISVVLLLVVLIAILFVLSVVEKLSKRYIVVSGTFLMFEFACYFALYRCYYRIGVKGFPFIVYVVDNIPAILLMFMIRSITGRLQGSLRCAPLAGSRTNLTPFPS